MPWTLLDVMSAGPFGQHHRIVFVLVLDDQELKGFEHFMS
jgi:hypothetical protein